MPAALPPPARRRRGEHRQLASTLERLKAIRYTSEGRTIVQATTIGPELADTFKKLEIATPKAILAVS